MANQDLINYIKQSREQGVSDEEIKKVLLEQGWAENDIDEGLKAVGGVKAVEQPASPAGGPIKKPKPKPKPKWLLPVIVIVGIIVLGVGVWAGYNYWLKPAAPEEQSAEEQQEEKPDETADWKTYRNEEYGFEFKYPKEWDFQADPPSVSNLLYLRFSKYDKAPEVLGPNMLATTNTKSDLDTLRESIESGETKEVIGETQEILWATIKPINLDGKVVRFIAGFYAPGGSFYQMIQFFVKRDLIRLWVNLPPYSISQKDRDQDPGLTRRLIEQIEARQVNTETLEVMDNFNQILSTFKFIESEIVDCGEIGSDNLDPTGERQSCFEAKFKECKPAKLIISIDLGPLGGLTSHYYEIIGPSDNLCAVKSKYLKVLNPEWVNKEMICRYDNSMELEEAINDMSNCQGELYNLMNPPSKAMLYKGVSVTNSQLSLKIGFSGKRDSKYILSVEHTQNASCGKKEILLPPDGSYSCDGKSYIFKLDVAGSDDNQITFSTQVQKEE